MEGLGRVYSKSQRRYVPLIQPEEALPRGVVYALHQKHLKEERQRLAEQAIGTCPHCHMVRAMNGSCGC